MITPFFRPNIGGVEGHLNDLCNYLTKKNYFLYVITYQPLTTKIRAPSLEKRTNFEIHRFWWPGFNLFHKLEPFLFLEFLYLTPCLFLVSFFFLLRNHRKIDVIHAHGLNSAFVVKFLAKIFRKKTLMSTYSIYNFVPKTLFSRVVRWTLSSFDEIQALANPSKKELLKIGLDENKLRVYYLWVDRNNSNFISRDNAKKKIKLSDKFVVLFVGRLIPIKGPRLVIEVAKRLPEIQFVLVGDGPLADELRHEAEKYSNIIFVGRVDEEAKNIYFHAADLFVLPSQYEEAFGKVAIEALFAGTPVIGSNRGAIPDIINTKVGRVVEPTVENFRRELDYFFHNPYKLKLLAKNTRKYAKEHFSEKNAEVIERGYL